MPKATESQRKAFGNALNHALLERAATLPAGTRPDEWLAEQISVTPQAIRNWLAGIREPNRGRIALMEIALDLQQHDLGRHLGIGVSDSERLDQLEAQVAALNSRLESVLEQLAQAPPPASPSRPRSARAGRSGS